MSCFEHQRAKGYSLMGSYEKLYFDYIVKSLGGKPINSFVVCDVNSFMFTRACIKEGCSDGFRTYGPFILENKSPYRMLVTEHILINYCKKFNLVIPNYTIVNLVKPLT